MKTLPKNNIIVSVLLLGIFTFSSMEVMAQFPPRPEDHFWRRKVVNLIDFTEKVNWPLTQKESHFYQQYDMGMQKNGLIETLFKGLKEGRYVAYDPDSIKKTMNYGDILGEIKEINGSLSGEVEDFEGGEGDGFEGDSGDGGEWGEFESGESEGEGGGSMEAPKPVVAGDFDPAPFESYITFVEDRIFDKNRSDMVYDIQYFEITWVDPGETLRDRKLCVFKYKDVLEAMENTQYKNKYNDAEDRNLREIMELRMFNSYVTNVSNVNFGVKTLEEAEYRKQQMVDFEHHLWSY